MLSSSSSTGCSPSNYLSGECDPNIQNDRERRLRSMLTTSSSSPNVSRKDSSNASLSNSSGKIDAGTDDGCGIIMSKRIQNRNHGKFSIQVIESDDGDKEENDTDDLLRKNVNNDSTKMEDEDVDGDEGPPPIFSMEEGDNRQDTATLVSSQHIPSSGDKDDATQSKGSSSSSTSMSLMGRMMAEASLANKKKSNERIKVERKRATKSSFGMKKGFLNGSAFKGEKPRNKTKASDNRSDKSLQRNDSRRDEEQPVFELDKEGNIIPLPTPKPERKPNHQRSDIETLRPNSSSSTTNNINANPLRLQEVQDALRQHSSVTAADTPGLIDRISQDPQLLHGMVDPVMTDALEAFKEDPKGAMKRFKDRPEVMEFLRKLCGAIGEHYTDLGVAQEKEKERKEKERVREEMERKRREVGPMERDALRREEKRRMECKKACDDGLRSDERKKLDAIMADKDLTAMLMDRDMQRVMQECSTGGRMRTYMQHPEYGPKLRKMIEAGLLKVA